MPDARFNTRLAAVGLSLINTGACGTVSWVATRLLISDAIPTGAAVEAVTRIFKEGRLYFIPAGFLASGLYFQLARDAPGKLMDSPYVWAGVLQAMPIFFTYAVMMKPCIGPLNAAHSGGGAAGSAARLGGEAEAERLMKLFGWLNMVRVAMFGWGAYVGLKAVMEGK